MCPWIGLTTYPGMSPRSCHCVVTQPLNYFAVWLQSLDRFSVYQVNLFPTAGQAVGLVFTLLFGWLSDGLNMRWQILAIPAVRYTRITNPMQLVYTANR